MFYFAIIFHKYLFVNLLCRIMSLIKIMKGIYMEPLKSLTFKYNAFTPAFRRTIFVVSIIIAFLFWFLLFTNADFTLSSDFITVLLIYLIFGIGRFITPYGALFLFCLILIYIGLIVPAQFVLLLLDAHDSSGNAYFYEDYVLLTYNKKESRLDKNETFIDFNIRNKNQLSCLITTFQGKVLFMSSKTEITRGNNYEQTSLYSVMNEIIEFVCPKTTKSDDTTDEL